MQQGSKGVKVCIPVSRGDSFNKNHNVAEISAHKLSKLQSDLKREVAKTSRWWGVLI